MFNRVHSPEDVRPASRPLSRDAFLHGAQKAIPSTLRHRRHRRGRYRAEHARREAD